jgi:hypothetical protein
LRDDEVVDWLNDGASFRKSQEEIRSDRFLGGIRLLICERIGFRPMGFAMSERSFLAVEKAFGLPDGALAVLNSNAGEHSVSFDFGIDETEQETDAPKSAGEKQISIL